MGSGICPVIQDGNHWPWMILKVTDNQYGRLSSFPLWSADGSTVFGGHMPSLAMVMNQNDITRTMSPVAINIHFSHWWNNELFLNIPGKFPFKSKHFPGLYRRQCKWMHFSEHSECLHVPLQLSIEDIKSHSKAKWLQVFLYRYNNQHRCKLESSQSPHISAKAMLFARWQHHLWFCSGFPYAPSKAMVTKISKRSWIQDSFQITPKIESLVVYAMPDIPSKFQKDPSITFWVILLTDRQTDKQSLAKTLPPWQR